MPAIRTAAQIEASRRNGARSRGPITEEGKARASRNAIRHGLTATHHLVLEDEVPGDLDQLIATVTAETGATSEIEARLARRLAIAFWKGERAERIETALFDAAPTRRPPQRGFEWEEADPLTTFDVRRFNAIRSCQAQQGREIARCLAELRRLRNDPLPAGTDEPEAFAENEPEPAPAPANDDLVRPPQPPAAAVRNEPDDPWDALPRPVRAELDALLARDDWAGLARLGATGALAPLGMRPEDTASPEALGRFVSRAMRAAAA
jgi:hypothetical protein